MKKADIFPAWGRILRGHRPFLSLEITKECPLRCPGCYAYEPSHIAGAGSLHQLADFKGQELIEGALALIRRFRPLHVSIVGGEPLVRYRELDELLPKLARMGIEVQLVTSAVRPIPRSWASIPKLHLTVSIDGLQPEHDKRRAPATYARIIEHIAGHRITVHCTITRQLLERPGYLREFCEFWTQFDEVYKIWFSLYTPQQGESSQERLTEQNRADVIRELAQLRADFQKVHMPDDVLNGYLHPPQSPRECIFSQVTHCITADLKSRITPCQFGGEPVCSECGCMASAGMAAIGNHRLAGIVKLSEIMALSKSIGQRFNPAPAANEA